jgi:hypothetical protein
LLDFLATAAKYGRLLLIVGLLAGLLLPDAARVVRPFVGELIASLLFLSCLRIGLRQAIGAAADIGVGLKATLALQLVFPIALVLIFRAVGWTGPTPLALTLVAAASPIAGSPNLVAMIGRDPAPALRQLVVGTALLPFTALAVFLLAPDLGSVGILFAAAGRLLLVIGIAAFIGFGIRAIVLKELSSRTRAAIDGCSAIVMAVVVVGLMAAIGETWSTDPRAVLATAAIAFVANFALQITTSLLVARVGEPHLAVPLGVCAGNRNVALFLSALPAMTTDSALLFIGCYQVPMYLTPLLLGRWYRSTSEYGGLS